MNSLKKEYNDKIVPELTKKYNKEIVKSLMDQFKYDSVMQVPKLEKIVVNMGVGEAAHDEKFMEAAVKDLETITGQKAVVTKARKSIAGFKIREGQSIGCKVTLRGENMYNFLEKLIRIALPRVRDFRGISKTAFDGKGNYTLGIKEQLIFPEIDYDNILQVIGMDIVLVTSAKTNEEGLALLSAFGLPFRK